MNHDRARHLAYRRQLLEQADTKVVSLESWEPEDPPPLTYEQRLYAEPRPKPPVVAERGFDAELRRIRRKDELRRVMRKHHPYLRVVS